MILVELCQLLQQPKKECIYGATENARPNIAILDNARLYSKCGHRETYFSVRVSCMSVSNSFLRHLCVLLYTVYVFNVFFDETK